MIEESLDVKQTKIFPFFSFSFVLLSLSLSLPLSRSLTHDASSRILYGYDRTIKLHVHQISCYTIVKRATPILWKQTKRINSSGYARTGWLVDGWYMIKFVGVVFALAAMDGKMISIWCFFMRNFIVLMDFLRHVLLLPLPFYLSLSLTL